MVVNHGINLLLSNSCYDAFRIIYVRDWIISVVILPSQISRFHPSKAFRSINGHLWGQNCNNRCSFISIVYISIVITEVIVGNDG